MTRLAIAAAAALATTLLTAAAPKPKPKPAALEEPAPSGLTPPADDAVIVGSCRVAGGACVDYEGTLTAADAQARCQKARGTFQAAACPAEGVVGTCRVRDTGSDDRQLTRFYKPTTEKAARAECKKQPRAVYLAR